MTADQYVESILAKYEVPRGSTSPRSGSVPSWPDPFARGLASN